MLNFWVSVANADIALQKNKVILQPPQLVDSNRRSRNIKTHDLA